MKNRFSIEKFMNSVIVEADKQIKAEAKSHPESRGMGTTIVIGWLLDGKLYLSWCGDSRAYIYNPQVGLHQISKDHSYVQSLVDKGVISKEDAFDYPESNIITRCLSDSPTKAKPESLLQPYGICNNDIIMLCTDGLSSMIRDSEIESIIRKNEHDMDTCSDLLIRAACDAEGADNITICMCQILQGAGVCNPQVLEAFDKRLEGPDYKSGKISDIISTKITRNGRFWNKLIIAVSFLLVIAAISVGIAYKQGMFIRENKVAQKDSMEIAKENPVATQTIVATNGSHFILERGDGNPQLGDRAYPDGSYDDKSTITIKDSVVTLIENKDVRTIEKDPEKVGSDVSEKEKEKSRRTGKKDGNIFDGYKTNEEKPSTTIDGGAEEQVPEGEDDLNLVKKPQYVDIIHEVKTDETLFFISRHYNISVDDIKRLNPFIKGNNIKPGDRLKIRFIKIK